MSRYGDDRYFNRGRDADYPSRDRSRSRDSYSAGRSHGPGPFRGGGNGGYGRGRGSGGRGGGRGGGGGGGFAPRPNQMMVKTNYFKIEIDDSKSEWMQYKVSIFKLKRCKEGENPLKNEDGSPKREIGKEILCAKSTEMTRRILKKLSDDLRSQRKIELVTDGSGTAFSNVPFFEGKEELFDVNVRTDCDDDDPDAEYSRKMFVKVKLSKVGKVNPREQHVSELEKIRQAMDIICKSALLSVGMKVFGRSPRVFYFPDEMQEKFIDPRSKLGDMFLREKKFTPIVGLMQAVRFCENGNIFFNCDSAVNFANREYAPRNRNDAERVSVPLLEVHADGRRGNILGISIDNVHQPITNGAKRAQIEAALKQIAFHVKYKSQDENERRKMKERGFADEDIDSKMVKLMKNKKMSIERPSEDKDQVPSKGIGMCIIWHADDPNLYTFLYGKPGEDKKPVTVTEYFRDRYCIRLKYPCMPIIHLGKSGWIPVEFLYQAFSKMKDANSDSQKNAVLEYYDRNAGNENVINIQNLLKQASRVLERRGLNVSHILSQYNMRLSESPIEVMAKVLPEPSVDFANEKARLNNGSWNLMGKKFSQPAELSSFAVADLSGKPHLASDFTNTLLKVAESHGMNVAHSDVQRLIAIGRGVITSPEEVKRIIKDAIESSRSFFLNNVTLSKLFNDRHVWYSTRVKNQNNQGWSDCLVLPYGRGDECGVILPRTVHPYTHLFVYQNEQKEGRMMVKVKERKDLIDPFCFRYNATLRCNEGLNGASWQRLTFETLVLVDENGRSFPYDVVNEVRPKLIVSKSRVECPSLVFVVLPNDSSEIYGLAKMFCHFYFGISCQCIVSTKYEGQRNKNQYCSNIAVKVNAKLSNHINKARAWTTSPAGQSSVGITWVQEVPTMVLGISTSSSLGVDGVSVICATASMDKGCMRFAQDVRICSKSKTETIDGALISSLVQSLLVQFYLHNDQIYPTRLLVYRDGVNEGSFNRVRKYEIESIREGYLNFVQANKGSRPTCTNECRSGCVFCCPPITLVACMTRSNVKIVPANPREGNKNNVWSGTCVDATLIDKVDSLSLDNSPIDGKNAVMEPLLYSEPGGGGYDFLLTAQGGLKGTSKPVHYRIIWNENAVHHQRTGGSCLSKEKLEFATYEMSYQYSTATKSVRLVPVIRYSAKCAETVLKYARYLKDHELTVKELDEEVDYGRSGSGSRKVLVRLDAETNGFSSGSFSILPYFLPTFNADGQISSARCSSSHISA